MGAGTIRHQFASDNTAAICPEAWTALEQANTSYAASYGEDEWTAKVCDRIREIFEVDCDVYFAFTGTGANALGLAQVCQSFPKTERSTSVRQKNSSCNRWSCTGT